MLLRFSRTFAFCGTLALVSSSSTAWGQVGYGGICCPPPVQPCFQQVPVTEMRECRQVVQRPVVETAYVDQPCTEMRQVCETKTAVIPTVCYQPVTECRTVQRDMGQWVTQYHCRPQMTACQYDGRQDILGALNRTGYSLRMAFTPKVYAERTYVPNVVAQQVPFTRQVAVHGTKTVNYQVSRMVPYTTTRRVAVNTVRMISQEIVTRQPVTVMKTVPYGNAMAYGVPYGAPQAAYGVPYGAPPLAYGGLPYGAPAPLPPGALPRQANLSPSIQPVPDPVSEARVLRNPDMIKVAPKPSAGPNDTNGRDEADISEDSLLRKPPVKSGQNRTKRSNDYDDVAPKTEAHQVDANADAEPQVATTTPSAIRVGRWVARRAPVAPKAVAPSGPAFPETMISAIDTKKARR